MDRSSMRKVETTHDYEKRLAFKAKLASQLEETPLAELQAPQVHPLTFKEVWHPDLGYCFVASVDEDKNSLVLRVVNQDIEVDLVFSQAVSKLIPTDKAPEHVPIKPFVRESFKAPAKKERGSVSVTLPEAFKNWSFASKYHHLAYNQHLATQEVNDVFAVLDGKAPLFNSVLINWENPVPPEAAEPVVETIKEPTSHELVGQTVWHLDLGKCTVLSVDSKNIVLDFPDKGVLEMVLSLTQPRLSMTEIITLDHTSKYVSPAPKISKTVKEQPVKTLQVVLPPVFKTWDARKQYLYLSTERLLTPEEANDVVAIQEGKSPVSKTQFQIVWDENADQAKVEAANRRLEKLVKTPARVEAPVPEPVDLGVQRIVEEVEVIKKEIAAVKLSVTLPQAFKTWSPADQFIYLSRTKHLTSDEAHDVMAISDGKRPYYNKSQFEIMWSD